MQGKKELIAIGAILMISLCSCATTFQRPSCASLAGKEIKADKIGLPTTGAVITSAAVVPAAPRTTDPQTGGIVLPMPEYCKVEGMIRPVDPKAPPIRYELHLPTDWNGKSFHFGGGGLDGVVIYDTVPILGAIKGATYPERPDSPLPIMRGYATYGSDSGHNSPIFDATFALNDESLLNFAYAALKKVKDTAFEIITLYYGKPPKHNYFYGSSNGGRQGHTVVQRFPDDYDGVIAAVPIISEEGTHIHDNAALTSLAKGGWMNKKKIELIEKSTTDLCDALDGLKDGIISKYGKLDPNLGWHAACPHDASVLRCPSGSDEGDMCLSDAQLATVRVLRDRFVFPFKLASGTTDYVGYGAMGGEAGPNMWLPADIGGKAPPVPQPPGIWFSPDVPLVAYFGHANMRFMVARDPNFQTYDFDPVRYKDRIQFLSSIMDSINPDISRFMGRGGKLIMKENTCDYFRSMFLGVNYYKSLLDKFGEPTVDKSVRLYVAAGADHFGQGAPSQADLISTLEEWVEKGIAPPKNIVAVDMNPTSFKVRSSRPMCGYGLYPKYKGSGDPKDASSFTCVPLID